MIELRGVSKTVQSGGQPLTILHPLDLDVPPGQWLAIVGPSGSGKSTLLGLIAGLDAPTSGEISIDGVDITALDEDALARLRGEKIGFVFQFFHLVPSLTALENILVPMEIAGRRDAAGARAGAARRSGPARSRASLSVAAVGRRAAARGHRAGAGQRSAAHPGRRADRQSRQHQRAPHPRPAARRATRARRHAGAGDARRRAWRRWPTRGWRCAMAGRSIDERRTVGAAPRHDVRLAMAVREMRASWRRLLFFFICLAIGVGAIVTLRSVIQSVRGVFAGEARSLIAADAIITSNQPLEAGRSTRASTTRLTAAGRRQPRVGRDRDDGAAGRSRPTAARGWWSCAPSSRRFRIYGALKLADGSRIDHALLADLGALVRPELLAQLDSRSATRCRSASQRFTIRGVHRSRARPPPRRVQPRAARLHRSAPPSSRPACSASAAAPAIQRLLKVPDARSTR